MTPIEALIQIARKVERDPGTHLNELATLARSGLRASGSHRVLTVEHQGDRWRYVCCCGYSASVMATAHGDGLPSGEHLTDLVRTTV